MRLKIVSLLLFSISIFGNNISEDIFINKIIEKASFAITSINKNKIYLDESLLFFEDKSVFLRGNAEKIKINMLFSDEQGIYTKIDYDRDQAILFQCTSCLYVYEPSVFYLYKCPRCGGGGVLYDTGR